MVKEKLKKKLKICAIRKGFNTIGAFCKEMGISESCLSLIINCKRNASIQVAKKIVELTKDMGRDAVKLEDII